ncbi:MAG: M20/M25/M40 family metallo-hydrolase [Clostridia bacterium]|nr:M20/M25/M40 family metallo-hydrolase [Clostridia bacterium]
MNINRNELKNFIFSLCSTMSVSGFETRADAQLEALARDGFDAYECDRVGNHIFVKKCGKENAPKILIDAHFDEIGFVVTEVCDGGFLRICTMGGSDPAILQASEVIIYGKERIRGVVTSLPPHLRADKDDKSLPEIKELLVDTGYSKAELERIVTVGTPVGFAEGFCELLGDRIAGRSFDDKACGAAAFWAVKNTPAEKLAGDVYVLFSAYEETSRLGGVSAAAFGLLPDYAMITDVNLARVPDTKKYETVEIGKGVSIAVSAATCVPLTRATEELCKRCGIAHSMVAAPASTGTNSPSVNFTADGIPTVDIGLPLINMHTYSEIISLDDVEALCSLISEFVCDEDIAKEFSRAREEEWSVLK